MHPHLSAALAEARAAELGRRRRARPVVVAGGAPRADAMPPARGAWLDRAARPFVASPRTASPARYEGGRR